MKAKTLVSITLALTGTACASPAYDDATVASTAEALTLQECADQQTACFGANPFFGLLTCPLQYTACMVTAENGIPAQVTAAIGDARDCAQDGVSCVAGAGAPSELLACTTEEAACVAGIIDAQIPQIVAGTADCVEGAVQCIEASKTANDLAGCAETLEDCALDEVVSVLPPPVGVVVEDVGQCTIELGSCTTAATTPSALTACTEDYVQCIGGGLGVELPNVPVSDVVHCAEQAASCTFASESISDIGGCADELISCASDIVEEELTCEQQWTQCLAGNPFDFIRCSLELATCLN